MEIMSNRNMPSKTSKNQSSIGFDKFLQKNPSNEQIECWDKFQTVETAVQNRQLAKILFFTAIVFFSLGFIALIAAVVMVLFFNSPAQSVVIALSALDGVVFWGFRSLMVHYFPANPKNALPTSTPPQLPQ